MPESAPLVSSSILKLRLKRIISPRLANWQDILLINSRKGLSWSAYSFCKRMISGLQVIFLMILLLHWLRQQLFFICLNQLLTSFPIFFVLLHINFKFLLWLDLLLLTRRLYCFLFRRLIFLFLFGLLCFFMLCCFLFFRLFIWLQTLSMFNNCYFRIFLTSQVLVDIFKQLRLIKSINPCRRAWIFFIVFCLRNLFLFTISFFLLLRFFYDLRNLLLFALLIRLPINKILIQFLVFPNILFDDLRKSFFQQLIVLTQPFRKLKFCLQLLCNKCLSVLFQKEADQLQYLFLERSCL